jgi:predicted RNA-binding Zn-ribbon protein involved in translation (DUF1610 family)
MSAGSYRVEHSCSQCGAPVVVEESDRLFSCSHCRVRLYLAGGRVGKYCLPCHPSLRDESLVYVPYWHVRGAHFSVFLTETKGRFLDVSRLAFTPSGLPVSLGMRAQAMTMRPAVEGVSGSFVRPDLPFGEMIAGAERMARAFGGADRRARIYHRAFVGEAASLVFAPVVFRGGEVIDAVLDRPLEGARNGEGTDLSPLDDSGKWKVAFLPVICPNCGWDMPGERKSEVLPCPNCDRVWRVEGGRFVELPFTALRGEGDVALPFWKVEVEVEGVKLESFADLAELANLPITVRPEWRERRPSFWTPAFRTRPRLFLTLARHLSLRPPEGEMTASVPVGALHPVTVGQEAATESIKLILADSAAPRRDILPLLEDLRITPREKELVYLPCTARGGDLVQEECAMSVRRNSLRD